MSTPHNFGSMLSGQQGQFSSPSNSNVPNQPAAMQDMMNGAAAASPMAVPAVPRPSTSEISAPTYCKLGQETVQDVIARAQDLFQSLRNLQLPNGTISVSNAANDKKVRIQDQFKVVAILMKRLRYIYDKCCDLTKNLDMGYTHVETLIPLKEEWDGKSDERKNTEAYRQDCAERDALREQVKAVNEEMKDALDLMRRTVWEINAMLAMRNT